MTFIKFKLHLIASVFVAFQEVPEVKNLPANVGDLRDLGFDSWVRKIPWRRKWQLIPVFLPGKFHGQRSLSSYSSWGHKESDTLKWLSKHGIKIARRIINNLRYADDTTLMAESERN